MKRICALSILLFSASLVAQNTPPNPNDYTINVHVRSSQLGDRCGGVSFGSSTCSANQQLKVEIDGKRYELTSQDLYKHPAVLRIGDYRARVFKEDTRESFEYNRTYEFLFTDGSTRKYRMTGEDE